MFGEVYEFGPAVIKLSSRNVYDNASIANKNIEGIAKVYAHGKIIVPIQFLDRTIRGWYSLDTNDTMMTLKKDRALYYLIIEKLDTSRKVKDEVDDVKWSIENFSKENKLSGDLDLRDLFVNRNNEDYIQKLYNYIQDNFYKSNAIRVSETMAELVVIFRNVGKFYNWFDIHPGQFGRNFKGQLVAFDLDNPIEDYSNFDKHLVREIVRQVLREEYIDEIALRQKDLPNTTALFIREINQGYDLVLYDPKNKNVYGTITVAQRDHYGPNYFVTGVAAERGFGPFIYELAMMHLSREGNGLMPTRDGDVRDVAFNVWKQFFKRPDVKRETMTIDNPYYRFDILGFAKDDFDSDEEIEEMLSELKDYQIEGLEVFNTVYSMDVDSQYSNLINKAEEYSKLGFDSQIAIDKGSEFWDDAYMS